MATGEKLDKDRFRRDLGGEDEAYQEVARRLGLLQDDSLTRRSVGPLGPPQAARQPGRRKAEEVARILP